MQNEIEGTEQGFVIYKWMHSLSLRKSELLVYAVLNGFTNANGWYRGTYNQLASLTDMSRASVVHAATSLAEKGLIERVRTRDNEYNQLYCEMRVIKRSSKL